MAQLPGLNEAFGGFSAQAMAMAAAMAETPALCARLGMDARMLRLDELADLVQIALEEDERHAFEADAQAHGDVATVQANGMRAPERRSAGKPLQSTTVVGKAALQRQVRRLLREVRSALMRDDAAVLGAKLGSVGPGQVGRADLVGAPDASINATQTTGLAAVGMHGRLSTDVLERFRIAARQPSRRLDGQAQAALTARAGHGSGVGLAAPFAQAGLSRALRLNEAAAERAFLVAGAEPGDVDTVARAGQEAHSPASPAKVSVATSPPPRRALAAAVAQAAVADRRARVLAQLAVPSVGRRAGRAAAHAPTDLAVTRVAAMAPGWQRALGAWADAETPPTRAVGPAPAFGRPAASQAQPPRAWRGAAEALVALAPPAGDESAAAELSTVGTEPSTVGKPDAAGMPRWLTGQPDRSSSAAPRSTAAGPVGLRAQALMHALARRHAGGLLAPLADTASAGGALRAWRTAPAGYRDLGADRATVALGDDRAGPSPEAASAATAVAGGPVATSQGVARPGKPAVQPWARAAAAAISAVVAEAQRWAGRAAAVAQRPARGVLELARGGAVGPGKTAAGKTALGHAALTAEMPELLTARPLGRSDALSAWLEPAARPSQPSRTASRSAAPEGELTWLGPGEPTEAATATGAAPGPTAAAQASPRARVLAAGASAALVPAALRAALAVFGERATSPADASIAGAYLARFFGRPAATPAARRPGSGGAREMLALTEPGGPATVRGGRLPAAAGARRAEPAAEPVLRGMAALEALMAGPGAADTLLGQAAERAMQVEAAEQTLLAPAAEPVAGAGAAEAAEMAATPRVATAPARPQAPAWPSAQLHKFSPVGLGRGRGLLSRVRAAESSAAAPLTARASNARPSGAASWSARRAPAANAVGYGAAVLGGGELLGLTAGDATGFFGETAVTPGALRGADALAGWVAARRDGAPIRGHAAAVAGFSRDAGAGEFVQQDLAGGDGFAEPGGVNPRNMPANYSYQQAMASGSTYGNSPQATLIEAGGAAARQAQATARTAGPTASARATQASAMARVLSVTDSPTGNMLPLVAPAAHAVVTAAAAKPQSEHIVTSGYGPSQGTSATSLQGNSQGDGGQAHEGEGDASQGHDAQDVDALAAKIARSVLLRMQRERERRGQYG